ncbi:MAG: sulfatase family protein [Candidatus Zipacnadales bacterium]
MNVILIVIDTLRADHLGCYGYEYDTSPALDVLAAEGALFESFWAPCIPTHPGFTSIFTGTHGVRHRVVSQGRQGASLPPGLSTLPMLLRGFKDLTTVAIDSLGPGQPWFYYGYDHYITSRKGSAEWVTQAALQWLRAYGDEPFFMFLHPWDPHTPYQPPESYRWLFTEADPYEYEEEEWAAVTQQLVYPFFREFLYERMGNPRNFDYIRGQYDAEIRSCDDRLGEFFEALKSLGLWENTAILVTADHGESMTEHHIFFEHHGIYDCVLHIPLLLRVPERIRPGTRVRGMFQHMDIAPTVCDLVGREPAPQFMGCSLLPAACGEEDRGYEAIYATEASRLGRWAIRTSEWKLIKLIDPGQYHVDYDELFHVAEDPHETVNLIETYPNIRDELELRLNRWQAAQLGCQPDPVRVEMARGSPMEATRQEGLSYLKMSFDEWIKYYQERFCRPLHA